MTISNMGQTDREEKEKTEDPQTGTDGSPSESSSNTQPLTNQILNTWDVFIPGAPHKMTLK